jgi:charged multivesicular body protein 4
MSTRRCTLLPTLSALSHHIALSLYITAILIIRREELQDQHALSAEIGSVITSFPIGEQPDEDELDAELGNLEQEALDAKMLHTGPVPVGSQLDRLPAAGNTDRKSGQSRYQTYRSLTNLSIVKQPAKAQEEDDEEAELAKLRAEMAM